MTSEQVSLHLGDCRQVLPNLPSESIDCCVTDPPYGIRFVGERWDYDVPTAETWKTVFRVLKPGAFVLTFGGTRTYHRAVCELENAGFEIRDCIMWLYGTGFPKGKNLKPGYEPIVLARKPGLGAQLNIEACRVDGDGRWPSNLLHDGSEEVVAAFPAETSVAYSEKATRTPGQLFQMPAGVIKRYDMGGGSAARFFYCTKASRKDRDSGLADGTRNEHPTVKPQGLMQWLCRLACPPAGTVLDPFMGSGSTGRAAVTEGFQFVGIEKEEAYMEIAQRRVA